jgi:hypothetical protein
MNASSVGLNISTDVPSEGRDGTISLWIHQDLEGIAAVHCFAQYVVSPLIKHDRCVTYSLLRSNIHRLDHLKESDSPYEAH